MLFRLPRSAAARAKAEWQLDLYLRIARANPYTQWKEINEMVDQLLPTLDPLPPDIPDPKKGWARVQAEYERRVALRERRLPRRRGRARRDGGV
jgi:hypothetical protein